MKVFESVVTPVAIVENNFRRTCKAIHFGIVNMWTLKERSIGTLNPSRLRTTREQNEGKRSALSADSVCAFRESFVSCCFYLMLFVFGCLMFSVRCVSVYTYIYVYLYICFEMRLSMYWFGASCNIRRGVANIRYRPLYVIVCRRTHLKDASVD